MGSKLLNTLAIFMILMTIWWGVGEPVAVDLPALVVITSCAQVPKEAGFGDVQKLVNQKFDYRLYWNQGSTVDEQVARAIEDLLKAELSVEGAVQIDLLNNQPAKSEKRSGRIDTVFLILAEFTSVINALDCPWDVSGKKSSRSPSFFTAAQIPLLPILPG